ncbi:hypothetical protein LNJ05_12235 [Tenacibaculum finnmarkense genomovar ulcerans]|uniref:hypothetical protein n=1 Tax=Tenacibaculum finnmarkense TaxID=2781243 RepID=UPI001E2AAC2D|nr:hypothetical protein [Tenacibaculum finnmarkense]MCD8433530.1 hypothetical protein [Tenacibaculum finnmarkense genomovar ulcerans]
MIKKIEVKNGQNLIRIESDGFSECLKVNNLVSAIIWNTNYTYYAVSKEQSGIEFLKNILFHFEAIDEKNEMYNQVEKILRLFPNGKYEIEIQEINHRHYEITNDDVGFNKSLDEDKGEFTYCLHVEKNLIAFSKPYNEIDYKIVERYKNKIFDNKMKPLILVFNASQFIDDGFIIDGHHKLLAYNDLSINPNILRITKIDSKVKIYKNLISEYKYIMNEPELKHYKRLTLNNNEFF